MTLQNKVEKKVIKVNRPKHHLELLCIFSDIFLFLLHSLAVAFASVFQFNIPSICKSFDMANFCYIGVFNQLN